MNIQIFGTGKCFDTKKAMRYFKERKIPFQMIDMKEKGLSKGEYQRVRQAVGGLDAMIDPKCKDQDTLTLIKYLAGGGSRPESSRKSAGAQNSDCAKWSAGNGRIYAGCLEELEIRDLENKRL